MLNRVNRNGPQPILMGIISLLIGFVAQSQAVPNMLKIEREDSQLERKVDLSFGLKQLQGEVYITASTKPAPQIVGITDRDSTEEEEAVKALKLAGADDWRQIWRSKPIRASESGTKLPSSEKLTTHYKFSEPQPLKFDVKFTRGDKLIGSCVTFLSDIAANGQKVAFLEEPSRNSSDWIESDGVIVIEFEENLKDFDDEVAYEFVGRNFDPDTSMLPYITLTKQKDDGTWRAIDRTFMKDFHDDPKNPVFQPLSVRVSHITRESRRELQLRFICSVRNYDDPTADHEYLGEFDATYQELVPGRTFCCIKPDDMDENQNIVELKAKIKVPTFLNIVPGLDIQVFVALDFTSSNKQSGYDDEDLGMHTVGAHDEAEFNYYELAMSSIVPVVEHYDNDHLIPFSGFGGKKLGERRVSHFFFMKPLIASHRARKDENYNCNGSLDLLHTYRKVMLEGAITLSSPTFYSPTLKFVADEACKKRGSNDTFVLLVMLTDGEYDDNERAKAEIAKASDCPLSIILVGIGDEDFEALEELDNDDGVPFKGKDKGVVYESKADIVQHVVFKEYYDILARDEAMVQLKDAVLDEFPRHVTNYFKYHNLQPNTPQGRERPLEHLNSIKPVARNIHDLYADQLR